MEGTRMKQDEDKISLCGRDDMAKRWIPEHLSAKIYQGLREIYPYEKKIIGKHPVKIRESEGLYVISLYDDDMGYMQDMAISIHQLIAQNMTNQPLAHAFLRLMREALDTQDRLRNREKEKQE